MAAWILPSLVGELTLIATNDALTEIRFGASVGDETNENTPVLQKATEELNAYFAGTLREFTIPLAPKGTAFQQAVWQERKYSGLRRRAAHQRALTNPGTAHEMKE